MKIGIGSDHAGYQLKAYLIPLLEQAGHELLDTGCYSTDRVDFPEYTLKVVWNMVSGKVERGLLCCGNGYAAAMLANRIPGMRAAVCHDVFSARTTVEMGGANLLVFGQRVVGFELAWDLAQTWLRSEFRGLSVPRYQKRLEEVEELSERFSKATWREELEDIIHSFDQNSRS